MESLPPTLDKTYEKILVNIPPTCKDFAQKMLILLCYARRPLSLGELTDGIAVELGDTPTFNSKDKFRNIISLQKLCPGIVDVDTEADGENPTLRLAHSSVREYLESESIMASTKTAPFSINRVLANTQMACICLAIVLQENDAPTPSPREISAPFPKLTGPSTTLMPYASRYWNAHFRRGDDQSPARHQILRLFSQPDMFRRWVATWNHVDYDGILSGEPPSPLYYAVCLGLREFIPGILSRASLDVNAVGGTDGNALQAAAARGDERAVRILVDHGADVNIRCGVFGGALQAASHCGHEGIVRYLLDRGSDVNAREDGTHMSALYEASAEGHESIVELLISNGAHVNTLDEYGGTALHIASNRGHAHVVPILICHDALLDQEGGRYGTAVEAASRSGHHEMVQLLIDHGAKNFQCALQEAASRGYEQTVQVLLANKADVNACPKGPSSLELASANGHEGTVQLLIDSGAETDRWSLIKETPLERASAAGHGAIVRRLLDHGASVGDGFLGTALHSASLHGHDEIVQMLIDHGADVNAFSEQRGIPLLAAALNGHEGTVRILLHHKACLCDSHYYDDALRTISQRGYGSILPLLDAYGPSLLDDPAHNDVSRLLAQGGPDDLNIVTRNAVLQLFSALNARAPPDNDWLIGKYWHIDGNGFALANAPVR